MCGFLKNIFNSNKESKVESNEKCCLANVNIILLIMFICVLSSIVFNGSYRNCELSDINEKHTQKDLPKDSLNINTEINE